MTDFRARLYLNGRWVRVVVDGQTVARVDSEDRTSDNGQPGPADEWVAPAFWDIQLNGRWGVSFSDPTLTPGQVAEIVRAQAALGTARLCPTLITAPFESFVHGLRAIAAACESDPEVAARVAGIHLEGPYISPVDGFRGAHPYECVREPDWDEFRRFQDASGGHVVLVTLAPEHPGSVEFIEKAVGSGVTVALGHTSADGETLRAAADAGATLSTHLGNGIASPLPRHPNPIWEQAAIDGLSASFIADGHHIDPSTLKVLVRAKTPARVVLVSDASPLAGLPPGTYGPWAVHPSGKIVVAGTPYLAGSNQALEVGLNNLMAATGLSLAETFATVTSHPARLLRCPDPLLEPGRPANLVRFRLEREGAAGPPRIRLLSVCVDGTWTDAGPEPVRPHARTPAS
jgi:N-acetylglucosamine-6-phosphate deacetylase